MPNNKQILFDLLKRPEGVTYEQFCEVSSVGKHCFHGMITNFRINEDLDVVREGKVYSTDPDAKLKPRKNARKKPEYHRTFCGISKCPEDGSILRLVRNPNVCFQCFKEGRV